MTRFTPSPMRAGGLAAVAGIALIAAGCGSSASSGSRTSAAAAAPTMSSAAQAAASGPVLRTAKGPHGTYLTDRSGRALYLWVADHGDRSTCAGQCARAWPPLTVTGTPQAGHGASGSALGTTTRAGGAKQVTYDGHPLYYYVGDTTAGSVNGQGSDGFGAKWWLVAPSGSAITGSSSGGSAGSSGPGGGSSSGGSSGGGYSGGGY